MYIETSDIKIIIPRGHDGLPLQQKKRSKRQFRKKKKSKIVEKIVSKPSKECRKGSHGRCPIPDKCPCNCHR